MTNFSIDHIYFTPILPINIKRKNYPFATVGNGRITLNAEIYSLLHRANRFKYAELSYGRSKKTGEISLAVKLLENQSDNSFKFSVIKHGTNRIRNLVIDNSAIVISIFGEEGFNKSKRYESIKVDAEHNVVLISL